MLQEKILKEFADDQSLVRLYMTNGYQMTGTITEADASMVVLYSDGKYKYVLPSAISTLELETPRNRRA